MVVPKSAKDAPLFRDAFALAAVVLEDLDGGPFAELRARLKHGALRLLDLVTLLLSGTGARPRLDRLHAADEELRTLRVHLVLGRELLLLDDDAFVALAEQCDAIGRQIGGWLRHERGAG
jgi:hypothetical protein